MRGHVLAGGPASHACRRGSGSTRGFGFVGGVVAVYFWRACCGGMCWPVDRSAHGMPSRGSDSTRGFWFCGGALLPFILRACCGSMCWPVDRPATHAAAGAAARGIREGSCACVRADVAWALPRERQHEEVFGLGDSFTRSGALIRRRHAAGATRPRPAAGQARD